MLISCEVKFKPDSFDGERGTYIIKHKDNPNVILYKFSTEDPELGVLIGTRGVSLEFRDMISGKIVIISKKDSGSYIKELVNKLEKK